MIIGIYGDVTIKYTIVFIIFFYLFIYLNFLFIYFFIYLFIYLFINLPVLLCSSANRKSYYKTTVKVQIINLLKYII